MSSITVSITPDAAVTVTVDGVVQAPATVQQPPADVVEQGGLYRSATGRTWLYDPAGDCNLPWVRILDKHGLANGSLIGKRYAGTPEDISFPVRRLTEGPEIQR
jgi:hypothetical protein